MGRYLVTGASRGIGRAVVNSLAPQHEVWAVGRSESSLASLEVAGRIVVDLEQPELLEDRLPQFDALDGVIHCAGMVLHRSVADSRVSDWTRALTLNVVAVAELTRLLLPALRASEGMVVILNSGQGLGAGPFLSQYAASKFAVRAFADSLRAEEETIRVTSVYLGRTDTDMQRELKAAEGLPYRADAYLSTETVAQQLVHLLELPVGALMTDVTLRPVL